METVDIKTIAVLKEKNCKLFKLWNIFFDMFEIIGNVSAFYVYF